ncbi:hypothetical protein NKJ26_26675 [Mesorhizobium sp. M0152]|uniref:hypothetical protein n=1 Tax=Mesorhizobium sp. M0152 TaxID=2956898 RepID=UPI00333CFAA1
MLLDATQAPGAVEMPWLAMPPPRSGGQQRRLARLYARPRMMKLPQAYIVRWKQVFSENDTAADTAYAAARNAFHTAVTDVIEGIAAAAAPPKKRMLALARSSSRQEPAQPDRTTDPDEPIAAAMRRLAFSSTPIQRLGRISCR